MSVEDPLTPEEVRARVAEIADTAITDDESASGLETGLYTEILYELSQKGPEPWRTLAAEALKTAEIEFDRW